MGYENRLPPTATQKKVVDPPFSDTPISSGCWLVRLPLWKMMEWKSVGMMTFPIYGKIKKCSKPPTSLDIFRISFILSHILWKSKIHVPKHQADISWSSQSSIDEAPVSYTFHVPFFWYFNMFNLQLHNIGKMECITSMPNVDKPFHLPINISKLVNLYNPLFTCQRSNQGQLAEFLLLPIPADPMAVESHKGEMRLQDGAPQLWVTQPATPAQLKCLKIGPHSPHICQKNDL